MTLQLAVDGLGILEDLSQLATLVEALEICKEGTKGGLGFGGNCIPEGFGFKIHSTNVWQGLGNLTGGRNAQTPEAKSS